MEFSRLSRKDLQCLCKKNNIPANVTNLAMSLALTSLPHVEGLDEFLNPIKEGDGVVGTPPPRKPETIKVNSGVRRLNSNVDGIVLPGTPSVVPPSTRKRNPLPVSTPRKKEDVIVADDNHERVQIKHVPKTPSALSTSRTRASGRACPTSYNTRRSLRLMEKNLSNMTLMDTQHMAPNNLEQKMDDVVIGLQADHPVEEESNEIDECSDYLSNKSIVIGGAVDKNNIAGSNDLSQFELGTTQDALSVQAAGSANIIFAEQDGDALSVEVSDDADQYVAALVPVSSENNDLVNLIELVECNTDNHGSNEDDVNKYKNNGTLDVNCYQRFKPMFDADEKAADETNMAMFEEVTEDQEEQLEAKSEHSEESLEDIDKMDEISDAEFSIDSSADKSSMDEEIVFHESSLVDVTVYEAKYLVHNSEKLEVEAVFDISGQSSATLASEIDTTSDSPITITECCSESLEDQMDSENLILDSALVDVVVHEAEDMKVNSMSFCDVFGASYDIVAAELDPNSENSTDIEFCSESSGEKISIDVDKATLEFSLLDLSVPMAGELKGDYEKLDFEAEAEESEEHAEAENLNDNSENLDFKVQAVVSEEYAAGEENALDAASAFPPGLGGTCDPQIPQQVSHESAGKSIDDSPDALTFSVLSCSSNNLVGGDVTCEEIVIPKGESSIGELEMKSVRELKKMLRNLTLDGKPKCKSTNVEKEVGMPENGMTNVEAQHHG